MKTFQQRRLAPWEGTNVTETTDAGGPMKVAALLVALGCGELLLALAIIFFYLT